MIITKDSAKGSNSFKIPYSRGLPSHMAPKLLPNKKTEEYLVTSLYAQVLLQNRIPVIGIEVCEDDSNKGADTIVKILDSDNIEVQITRFTLTEFTKRRKIAENQVSNLIDKILTLTQIGLPINVTVNLTKPGLNPFKDQKLKDLLAEEIVIAIDAYRTELALSNKFFNHQVTNEKIKLITPIITVQSIPKDFHSSFYGKYNLYIDLDFDNIGFTKEDIEAECLNIYRKKNEGKAKVLIIWADTFEILYDPKTIIEKLKIQFQETTFKEVYFFHFYNSIPRYFESQTMIDIIKWNRT